MKHEVMKAIVFRNLVQLIYSKKKNQDLLDLKI